MLISFFMYSLHNLKYFLREKSHAYIEKLLKCVQFCICFVSGSILKQN